MQSISVVYGTAKGIDGLDEMAAGLCNFLPKIAKAPATASSLGLLSIFVLFGVLGMKEEFKEALEELTNILNQQETATAELAKFSDRWRTFLAKKFNVDFSRQPPPSSNSDGPINAEEMATELQKWEEAENKKFAGVLGKTYGWTGFAGMFGMLCGMLPNTTLNILSSAQAGSAAATAALTIAGGASFFIGQIFMSAYAINRWRQGESLEATLKETNARIHASTAISDDTKNSIIEINNKQLHYTYKLYKEYGVATLLGQLSMALASLTTLGVLSAPAATPCLAVGIPLTLGAAISRIVNTDKQEFFVGSESKYSQELLGNIRSESIVDAEHIKKAEEAFNIYSQKLAEIKFCSLLNHVINERSAVSYTPLKHLDIAPNYTEYTYAQKQARLDAIFKDNKLKYYTGYGTDLQGTIFDKVREIYEQEKTNGTLAAFLDADSKTANERLHERIKQCAGWADDIADLRKALLPLDLEDSPKPENESTSLLSSRDEYAKLNTELTSGLKQTFKMARYTMAETLVRAVHSQELQAKIKAEEQRQSAVSIPYKHESTSNILHYSTSNHEQQHSTTPQDISHAYRQLKESLTRADPILQHEKLHHYQQKAAKFPVVRHYKEKGNTIKIWHDPDHPDKGADYQIFYITNNATKETVIKYGRYVSATITAKGDPKQGIGVRVIEISNGYHSSYGDARNKQINIEKSGPAHSSKPHSSWATPSRKTFVEMVNRTSSYLRGA